MKKLVEKAAPTAAFGFLFASFGWFQTQNSKPKGYEVLGLWVNTYVFKIYRFIFYDLICEVPFPVICEFVKGWLR